MGTLQAFRGLQRRQQIERLRRGHRLNRHCVPRILHNLLQLDRGPHAHRDEVFLIPRSRNGVH